MPVYMEKKEKWTKDGRRYFFKCQYIDNYGNHKQKKSKLYLKAKEASNAENDFLNSYNKTEKITNNASFEKIYLEWLNYKKGTWKSQTYYKNKTVISKHIYEYFKKYKIYDLNFQKISQWKDQLVSKEMSIIHTNKIIGYLKDILEFATENYNLDLNFHKRLNKIKDENPKEVKSNAETNYWTLKEFQCFYITIDDEYYKLIFYFLYMTGLRFGEMIALNWNDIDLTNKTLSINKTLTTKVKKKPYIITSPKTKNSYRIIDLNDDLVDMLLQHKIEESKIFGFNNKMYIFGNIKFLSQTTVRRRLNKYIKKAGIKRITLHGFRHSHASLLFNLGCSSKEVADRLGDTIRVVENTYYHLFPEKKNHTIEVLNTLSDK